MGFILSSAWILPAGLLAVGCLIAIYILHKKSTIISVSSLMLWQDKGIPPESGKNISRILTPLLFFIELFILLLLIIAAADPLIRSSDSMSIVAVLDDSYSMLANNAAPRESAKKDLRNLLEEADNFKLRLIIAGKKPYIIDKPVRKIAELDKTLQNFWECRSPSTDINRALTLAGDIAGDTARILVLTDRKIERLSSKGQIEFWAYGTDYSNTAFINAGRKRIDGVDRCFTVISNFSDKIIETVLSVKTTDDSQTVLSKSIELGPLQKERITFTAPEGKTVKAEIEEDSLEIDNRILLVPDYEETIRLKIDFSSKSLKGAVSRAIDAIPGTKVTDVDPHIIFSDRHRQKVNKNTRNGWAVKFIEEKNPVSYIGPYILDRSHPITNGLSLKGVIWSRHRPAGAPGVPVIAAGNVPLIIDKKINSGLHEIIIYLNQRYSNLTESPNWPILFWNIVQWRRTAVSGMARSNVLIGMDAIFNVEGDVEKVVFINPDNEKNYLTVKDNSVSFNPSLPGIYQIEIKNKKYLIAANSMDSIESDLSKAESGKWGEWHLGSFFHWEYKGVAWLFLLFSLLLLAIHRYLTSPESKGDN